MIIVLNTNPVLIIIIEKILLRIQTIKNIQQQQQQQTIAK